jgi:hypothetical protein
VSKACNTRETRLVDHSARSRIPLRNGMCSHGQTHPSVGCALLAARRCISFSLHTKRANPTRPALCFGSRQAAPAPAAEASHLTFQLTQSQFCCAPAAGAGISSGVDSPDRTHSSSIELQQHQNQAKQAQLAISSTIQRSIGHRGRQSASPNPCRRSTMPTTTARLTRRGSSWSA